MLEDIASYVLPINLNNLRRLGISDGHIHSQKKIAWELGNSGGI
jgi:hypothetical protein